jgi:hypothetical protein
MLNLVIINNFEFFKSDLFILEKELSLLTNSLVNKKVFGLYIYKMLSKFINSCYYNNYNDLSSKFKF